MCGIAGVLHFDSDGVDPTLLGRMLAALGHRGPDAGGVWAEGPVGLGHRRLSILDLDGGRQPMSTPDGLLRVTFNGEIFNYVELRETLQQRGRRFATQSDTEVILHAYREYGEHCVEHFNGQWAFALWDQRRRRLFLSRDRLGIRPLYYTNADRRFLFASEVKSLFAHPDVPRAIDRRGLDQVFTFWSTLAPRTVFEGIRELQPGHAMIVEDGRVRTEPYWRLDYGRRFDTDDEERLAGELCDLLADATRLRLRADVPVGAYLSGGLDSSLNVALVRQWTHAPLRTFSVTFDDAEFDESDYQREVVAALGTRHESIRCRASEIGDVFADVIWHAERPVLRTAPAPLFVLSRLARECGFKVVLTGEGADEVFGGYDIFKEAKVRRFWAAEPESAFRALLLAKLYPYLPNLQSQPLAYRRAFFHVRGEDLANPFFSHLPRWELTSRLKRFFSPALRAELADRDPYADCAALLPEEYARWEPFCQAQFLESVTLLPGYILSSQGDRMAMAHGVEGRFPMLDHRLVEFAAKLPPRLKMKGLNEKYLLRKAAEGLVPERVLRRTKQPYRSPDAASFFSGGKAREEVAELLAGQRIAEDGLFDPRGVEKLVQKVRDGRAIGMKDNMALVGILSTQWLVEQFIRRRPAPTNPLPEIQHHGALSPEPLNP